MAEQQYRQMGDPASGERLKFDFRHASPHLFVLHMSLAAFILFSTFIYAFSAYLNGSTDGVRVSISHVIFMGTGMGFNVLLHSRHGLAHATRFFAWLTAIWYPMSTLSSLWHVAQAEDHAGLGAQRAANIERTRTIIWCAYMFYGVILETLDLPPFKRRSVLALHNFMGVLSSLLVWLRSGSYSWLVGVLASQTAPMCIGASFVALVEHCLVVPALADLAAKEAKKAKEANEANEARDRSKARASPPLAMQVEPAPGVFQNLSTVSEYQHSWREIKVLGSGAFSRVVQIQHVATGEMAACKQIYISNSNPEAIQRLKSEVKVLASLAGHEHIIRYRTCFQRGENLCIVTDVASGGSLDKVLKRRLALVKDDPSTPPKPFSYGRVITWATQLASAVTAMHAQDVIHRDIKPSNLFLTASEDLKIGDFGLSRPIDDAEALMATTSCGTPYYMSPEQVRQLEYSYPVDVWACGCVIFELLTLKRAFQARSFPDLARFIVGGDDEAGINTWQTEQLEARRALTPEAPPHRLMDLLSSDLGCLFHRDPRGRCPLIKLSAALWAESLDTPRASKQELLDSAPRAAAAADDLKRSSPHGLPLDLSGSGTTTRRLHSKASDEPVADTERFFAGGGMSSLSATKTHRDA